MPKLHVQKSIVINTPIDKAFNAVCDFNTWTQWSPWLIAEPEAQVTITDDARGYEWAGDITGKGSMKITDSSENKSIHIDLTFLTPYKSHAKVWFEFAEKEGGTEVSWFMDSSLPFFMFFMTKMMNALIGMDYQRGLYMLKDFLEDGTVHSKLERMGEKQYPGCQYIGINTHCNMADVGTQMGSDFEKLGAYFKDKEEIIEGQGFSIYHKWEMVKGEVSYTSGFPVKSIPEDLPGDFTTGKIPEGTVYTTRHTGPYLHLGNAWSAMQMYSRSKVFKYNKKIHPFETYENMPGSVPDNELITDIHFPVK